MRTIGLWLGLLILAATLAGCGGSTRKAAVLGVSRSDWAPGARLGSHGMLGDCTSAIGPKHKVLVVCHSTGSVAFGVSCWLVYGGPGKVVAETSWVDAGSDPDCKPAEQALDATGQPK